MTTTLLTAAARAACCVALAIGSGFLLSGGPDPVGGTTDVPWVSLAPTAPAPPPPPTRPLTTSDLSWQDGVKPAETLLPPPGVEH
jgi:hypothetical protein